MRQSKQPKTSKSVVEKILEANLAVLKIYEFNSVCELYCAIARLVTQFDALLESFRVLWTLMFKAECFIGAFFFWSVRQ